MDALIVIGLAAVISIGLVWSRVGLARSERRSMKNYKHGLEVLGGVSRRSSRAAPIRPVPPERATYGHIRTERPEPSEPARPPAGESPPPGRPRIPAPRAFTPIPPPSEPARPPAGESPPPGRPLIPPPRPFTPLPARPPRASIASPPAGTRFGDEDDALGPPRERDESTRVLPVMASSLRGGVRFERADPSRRSDPAGARGLSSRQAGEGRRSALGPLLGRVGTMAAVAVILIALSLVGVHLAASSSQAAGSTRPTTSHRAGAGHHRRHGHAPTGTTAPSALVPVSTSPTEVAFVAPKGSYTVQMTDTGGLCWIGIQQTTGGPYVWQDTLIAGQTTTYKASGPLVIRIGAPKYLGVKVNGLPARLPGFVQPYDVVFNPASPPSSA